MRPYLLRAVDQYGKRCVTDHAEAPSSRSRLTPSGESSCLVSPRAGTTSEAAGQQLIRPPHSSLEQEPFLLGHPSYGLVHYGLLSIEDIGTSRLAIRALQLHHGQVQLVQLLPELWTAPPASAWLPKNRKKLTAMSLRMRPIKDSLRLFITFVPTQASCN